MKTPLERLWLFLILSIELALHAFDWRVISIFALGLLFWGQPRLKLVLITSLLGVCLTQFQLLSNGSDPTSKRKATYETQRGLALERRAPRIFERFAPPGNILQQMKGALFQGKQNAISTENWSLFGQLGLAHLFVISGLHLAGLYFIAQKCLRGFGLKIFRWGGAFLLVSLLSYWGGSVSTWRASLFLALTEFVSLLFPSLNRYRRSEILATLGIGQLLISPLVLLQAGYCFSYGATWFLLRLAEAKAKGGVLKVSTFVWGLSKLMGIPILAVSPIINLLLIPIFLFLIIPMLLLSHCSEAVADFAEYSLDRFFQSLSWISAKFLIGDIFLQPLAFVALGIWMRKLGMFKFFILGSVFLLMTKINFTSEDLRIHAVDIGQGDALLVKNENTDLLVDGGGPGGGSLSLLPKIKDSLSGKLEGWVISHFDRDHIGNFLRFGRFLSPGAVFVPRLGRPEVARRIRAIAKDHLRSAEVAPIRQCFKRICMNGRWVGTRKLLQAVSNSDSLILSIEQRSNGKSLGVLLGDLSKGGEKRWIRRFKPLRTEILKIGHHGSKTSTSVEILRHLRPKVALITVGRENQYGFPHQEVLERLETWGVQVFRTDTLGSFYVNLAF